MGLFKKRSDDTAEMERLRADITSMASRLDTADAQNRQLDDRVQSITDRIDQPSSTPEPMTPPIPAATRVDLDAIRAQIRKMTERFDEIDARITSISTELANQLSEISGDLDTLGAAEPPSEQVIDELRDAQTRLANEQARYQIVFRHDLAELAASLKPLTR